MSNAGIARVVLFYLFLVLIVFCAAPLGPYLSYAIIVAVSLLFVLLAGVRPRPGDPLPGSAAGALAISAIFALTIASGGAAVAGVGGDAMAVLIPGLALQAFVACGEEAAFRGYLLGDLRQQYGLKAAIGLSAAGFAFLHLHSMLSADVDPATAAIGLATIAAAGVLLGIIYLRWGLLSAIGFHFFWNFLQYHVYGLGLRGDLPSLVELTQGGSALLTGGGYGPEASLPGLAVVLVTLGVVWYLYRRHETHSKQQF